MEKLKDLFEKIFTGNDGRNKSKKAIQNLCIVLGVGIIMLLIGGFFTKDNAKSIQKEDTNNQTVVSTEGYLDQYDKMMENKIKNILSQISGVGRVSVAITYSSSKEIVPAQDIKQNESNTNEKSQEGGVRNTIQSDTDSKVIVGQEKETKLVILKEIPPQVKGVIVVAEGAKDERVRVDIAKAVSIALGISLSKIQVFPMGT